MNITLNHCLQRIKLIPIIGLAAFSSACTTLPSFQKENYVNPMDGAAVVENKTRYSEALECLRPQLANSPNAKRRFAVGRVNDFTGKEDLTNGKRITQGAALMVISALSKSGVPLVERFDTTIADMELKYADNKLISDSAGADANAAYRKIFSGSLLGSDYHIVGGITEVNYNIRSGSVESSIKFLGASARYFVMNVAADLRVVNTKTLEVVNTQSLQKQIIGTELSGGYFRIFSDGLVDLTASERTQEPIQKGVRMVLEQAVFNMLTEMNQLPQGACLTKAQLKADSGDSDEKIAQDLNSKRASNRAMVRQTPASLSNPVAANPTFVSPVISPVTPSGNRAKTYIDPNTGEIMKASDVAGTAQAAPEETGRLKGLFGSSTQAGQSSSAQTGDDAAASRQVMQEKMLWGNRPTIK
ncbi:MAG: CsgG/HfaB family protein [Limnobacter sp.]|nr:CsgG/HfaB family protein [Limnobacter sp.]